MLTIQRESIDQVIDQIPALLEQHWREIAHFPDIPLDVDWGGYRAAENAGALRIFTARRDGTLVGYAVHFVRLAPHYRQSLQAVQDVLFVAPEERGGGVGRMLVEHADSALQGEGVVAVFQHVKAAHARALAPLLQGLGYELVDRVYAKRLDETSSEV